MVPSVRKLSKSVGLGLEPRWQRRDGRRLGPRNDKHRVATFGGYGGRSPVPRRRISGRGRAHYKVSSCQHYLIPWRILERGILEQGDRGAAIEGAELLAAEQDEGRRVAAGFLSGQRRKLRLGLAS
jgi:hypothetical protein